MAAHHPEAEGNSSDGPGNDVQVYSEDLRAASVGGMPVGDLSSKVETAMIELLIEVEVLRSEIQRLNEALSAAEDLADRDPLTPILNRRAFLRELERIQNVTRRYGTPASLVYFDVDKFALINNEFGHSVGDVALNAVARSLSESVRESDIVGRMGGDEFGIILFQAGHDIAEFKARSLAENLESKPLMVEDASISIRISYGVCEISAAAEAETIVATADTRMYAQKRERQGLY